MDWCGLIFSVVDCGAGVLARSETPVRGFDSELRSSPLLRKGALRASKIAERFCEPRFGSIAADQYQNKKSRHSRFGENAGFFYSDTGRGERI
jgi:hypothetical protein